MVEIKPYEEHLHREQVLNLFSDVAFKRDIWNYQFLDNPGARARGFSPVVAEEDGFVVGFNAVVPVSILWGGRPTSAMWSCDFKVNQGLRGKGIGRLIKVELAQRSPILMSFGISPVAAIVLERMGWQANNEVHFLRRIREPRSFRDWALMVFQFGTKLITRRTPPMVGSVSVTKQLPARVEIDSLWNSIAKGYDKAVVRNWDYLDWRYQQHPFASYQFIELRDRGRTLKALGVVREDGRQVRLVDYLGPAKSKGIKAAVIEAILSNWPGVASYSAMTSDPELKQAMKAAGFYQGREQPRFFVWASPESVSVAEPEQCIQGWFIMGGDSDGELLQSARETWTEKGTNKEGGECRLKTL